MSIKKITKIFNSTRYCTSNSLQLLKIGKDNYFTRKININPERKLTDLIEEITEKYIGHEKGKINEYIDIANYDGSVDSKTIYKIISTDVLIKEDYKRFSSKISNPDVEVNPFDMNYNAYLFSFDSKIDDKACCITMVSMQNPVTVLKNKFSKDKGEFKQLSEKVLSLRQIIDVIILNESDSEYSEIYFLTLNGEKLFNMERAYKKHAEAHIHKLKNSNILSDNDTFENIANKGHNPRKFLKFNEHNFEELQKEIVRVKQANQFDIPLTSDKKIDVSEEEVSEKIIKILCDKAMLDPFFGKPSEVSGAKDW